jgi:uncharacterized protein YyaL (SSP411 family)
VLDDYAFLAHAALDGFEATGEMRFYRAAEEIAESLLARFYDRTGHAFFDTDQTTDEGKLLGALTARRKPLQDSPTPAGNPVAAALLMRLEALSGNEEYLLAAQETLETFAGVVEHFGLYAATYGLALQRMLQRPVQVCVVGDDAEARRLEAVALARYAVNKSVIRIGRGQLGELPPILEETLPHLPMLNQNGSFAVVCSGNTCQPPVTTPEDLLRVLSEAM